MSKIITLELDSASEKSIAKMEKLTGGNTPYVIQNALRIYLYLIEEYNKGNEFLIRCPKEGITKVKVFTP